MKKSLLFALMAAFAFTFTACEGPDKGGKTPVDLPACAEHDNDVVAKYLGGCYFHNEYSDTAYNYNVALSADDSREVLDIVTGMVDIVEDKPLYFLDIFSAESAPELNKKFNVPVGKYVFDAEDTCAPGTLSPQYTYMMVLNAETYEYDYVEFAAGEVNVTKDLIDAFLVDVDGKTHHVRYAGREIDNTDNFGTWKDEGTFSTLTGDLTLSFEENMAVTENYGDYYVVGMNAWDVVIFDFATNSQLYLQVLAPLADEKLKGEFPVSSDLNKSQMVLPGFVSANFATWSWYDIYDSNDEWVGGAPITAGKMVLSDNADGSSHVVVDFKDDAGHSIKAEFDADLFSNGGASPWASRSGVTMIKKPHAQKIPFAKAKLHTVKR